MSRKHRLWWNDGKSGMPRILFRVGSLSVNLYDHGWAFGFRGRAVDFFRFAVLYVPNLKARMENANAL